ARSALGKALARSTFSARARIRVSRSSGRWSAGEKSGSMFASLGAPTVVGATRRRGRDTPIFDTPRRFVCQWFPVPSLLWITRAHADETRMFALIGARPRARKAVHRSVHNRVDERWKAVENDSDVTTSPCGHPRGASLYVVLRSRQRFAGATRVQE